MSVVTGSMTLSQLLVLYQENCSWEEDADIVKAKAFVTVCTALIPKLPSQSGKGSASMSLNTAMVQEQQALARTFIKSYRSTTGATGSGSAIHASFNNFRD